MQLYGRGLRRRLPPMLDGDPRRMRMVYSLMFSLPGTPVLFYGEEIGMGENLDIDGRLAVRTPMQWTGARSTAASRRRAEGPGPSGASTAASAPSTSTSPTSASDPDSLLGFMELLIRALPRSRPSSAGPTLHVLDQPHHDVLAHECRWDDRRLVALHNFGAEPRTVPLQLDRTASAGSPSTSPSAWSSSTRPGRPRCRSRATATAGCA